MVKYFNLFSGFPPGWDSAYSVQLALRSCRRFLVIAPARKHPITPQMLSSMVPLFNLANPLHAAMWALFCCVLLFSRKSNLVIHSLRAISDKVPRRCDFVLTSDGAFFTIRASKTIQFLQHTLSIPLPIIPHSVLSPVSALYNHFRLNSLGLSDFLFSVKASASSPPRPLTCRHFLFFLSKVIASLQLDHHYYFPHSFLRRGGASFAFECNVPAELIKFQGDWHSDA